MVDQYRGLLSYSLTKSFLCFPLDLCQLGLKFRVSALRLVARDVISFVG